jgi:ketosteroid isomerase-like protein
MTRAVKSQAEAEIHQIVTGWTTALYEKDVDARTAGYDTDVVIFDVIDPLQHHGLESVRRRLADWLSSFQGPVGCEVRDLHVVAGDDVAFCHSLNRFSGTTTNGDPLNMWVRFTVGFHKVDGAWTVVHEHASVPFNPGTGRASTTIEP